MNDLQSLQDIDALVHRFFDAFDNRGGRTPAIETITDLFADKAVIATHAAGHCELSTPGEFAAPRVGLLVDGDLVDFHEWEASASTQIVGGIASRVSRYAKSGVLRGDAYAGAGTKFFQIAAVATGWRIVALSWIDDDAPRDDVHDEGTDGLPQDQH